MMGREDIYLSAMRGADGTINVGYLVLFRSGRAVILICAAMVAGAFLEMYFSPTHQFRVDALGTAIAALVAAFGVLLAALGAYLWGDSKQVPVASTTTALTKVEPMEAPNADIAQTKTKTKAARKR